MDEQRLAADRKERNKAYEINEDESDCSSLGQRTSGRGNLLRASDGFRAFSDGCRLCNGVYRFPAKRAE